MQRGPARPARVRNVAPARAAPRRDRPRRSARLRHPLPFPRLAPARRSSASSTTRPRCSSCRSTAARSMSPAAAATATSRWAAPRGGGQAGFRREGGRAGGWAGWLGCSGSCTATGPWCMKLRASNAFSPRLLMRTYSLPGPQVANLYTDEVSKYTFKRPITAVALDPRYGARKTREMATGDVRGRLKISSQARGGGARGARGGGAERGATGGLPGVEQRVARRFRAARTPPGAGPRPPQPPPTRPPPRLTWTAPGIAPRLGSRLTRAGWAAATTLCTRGRGPSRRRSGKATPWRGPTPAACGCAGGGQGRGGARLRASTREGSVQLCRLAHTAPACAATRLSPAPPPLPPPRPRCTPPATTS